MVNYLDMKDTQSIVLASVVGAAVLVLYYFWKKGNKASKWKEVAYVDELFIHPVKSCRGCPVKSFTTAHNGILVNDCEIGDRCFMMTHENGRFATIRQYPKMVLITPTVIPPDKLMLEAPDMEPIEIQAPRPDSAQVGSYKIFGTFSQGIDCGDKVAQWLEKFTKAPNARLVYHGPYMPDKEGTKLLQFGHLGVYAKETIKSKFHDFAPFNVVSQASIDYLNTKLDKEHQTTARNFRPNVLLKGCNAFEEDSWDRIKIGGTELKFSNFCTRCKVPTVDPETGIMDSESRVLTTLRSFRLCTPEEKPLYGNSPKFCVDFIIGQGGKIKVGDKVYLYVDN